MKFNIQLFKHFSKMLKFSCSLIDITLESGYRISRNIPCDMLMLKMFDREFAIFKACVEMPIRSTSRSYCRWYNRFAFHPSKFFILFTKKKR